LLTTPSLLATRGTCARAGLGIEANRPTPERAYFTSNFKGFHASGMLFVQSAGSKPEGAT
jgi:hypothetical protein